MLALLANWFLGSFIPHGHCYLWKPGLVGLHLVSDSIIALAYYSIPLTLLYFVRKRRDLPFDWIFLLFGAFIVACGTTHILAVWTLWQPNYWFSGFIKAITAAISLSTAVLLIRLIPKALALPSPAQLEEANRQLASEIRQRTASETRYRTLVETSPNAISVSDLDGKLLFCNRQVAVLHGYERETDIPGMSACELIAPEDRPRAAENLQEILRLGSIKDVEYSMLRKDGSRFPAECRASLMRDAQGNPQALIGLVQDITQRKSAEEALKKAKEDLAQRVEKRTAQLKQANDHLLIEIQERRLAEEALRQSEERLNLALGAAQMGAWDWDMLSDRVNWSDRVEAIFGLTPGTFGGTYEAVLNCLHPEDRPVVTQAVKRSVETGTNYEVEARVCEPDGTIRWIATLGAVLRDASGKAVRMTGTVMDITKRKNVELALERERQQLRQIISSAPVAMALFDTQMHYLAHSQKWLTVQRLQGQSIIDHSHYEIFPDLPDRWKTIHQRALQGEVVSASEDVWERADGTKDYLRWAIHPWYTPEGEIGGIVIATDYINELVEAREAALEAVRIKSEFLANMSHEIRTPMNGVLGMAGLLLQTPLTPQQLEYAKTIRSSAEHLLTVINDILDFSKLEAGEMLLEQIDFDLDKCIESVVDVLRAQAEEKGVELAIRVESNVPRQLQGDPVRLRQILLNLAGNAVKFTAAGEVLVKATIELEGSGELKVERSNQSCNLQPVTPIQPSNNLKIRFEVKDTGIGISPADQQKLFQSFSQVDASMTRQYGGTGLGLIICKQLVELMGGEIGVESVLGQGSMFWFTASFGLQVGSVATDDPLIFSKLKLLVASDNATTRQSVRSLVEPWGMETDEAADSTATLKALRSSADRGHPYDVAILDLQMPDNQGALIVPMIRCDPTLAQTKLIVMTTIHTLDSVQELESMDLSGYLIKPVRASRLFDLLVSVFPDHARSAMSSAVRQATIAPENGIRHRVSGIREEANTKDLEPPQSLPKILLVEDHPVNQLVILNQLQMLGYEADCVDNGKDAIAKLQAQNYDIVLMDCQMPVLDGYQATQELRLREGLHRHTVVIALTAHALAGDREKCLTAGMDDYLSKPVDQEALGAMIQRWVKHTAKPEVKNTPEPSLPSLNETPLDLQRLHNLSRGRVTFQKRLVQAFVDHAQPGLEQIRRALQVNDFVTVEQQAHRIKGASANVGVLLMPDVAAQLERQAREKTLEGATERLQGLERQLEQVKVFLNNWLV